MPALDYARDVARVYGDKPGQTPRLMGMGLYQGYELGNAGREAYQRALQTVAPLHKGGPRAIHAQGSRHPDELRRALSVYFMLGHPDAWPARHCDAG